ncbi:hypothetical protein [Hymenobacter rigui]|uniref:T9SS C-terminal target domain-containing protein n=1 Tax=Hymenobacter rigui TaxID=334424 RepID=A0A3R9PAT5_9BACT|nr:hypothetical protein [Hymenobacter rigui]RSK48063.1 hypothetical protein EI291_13325 [Hymenobacter rigui]
MKILFLLLCTSLPLLSYTPQWHCIAAGETESSEQAGTCAAARAGLVVVPDAENKGYFQVQLPARHGALQVSVLDAQNHPVQPPQLVAAATVSLTLDTRQWPAGHYQLQVRSASGLISTSLHIR